MYIDVLCTMYIVVSQCETLCATETVTVTVPARLCVCVRVCVVKLHVEQVNMYEVPRTSSYLVRGT